MLTRLMQPTRGGTWRRAAVLGALLLLTLFVGAQGVFAEGEVNVACMNTSPCTANDVRISSMTVLNTPACLDDPNIPGTDLYANVLVEAEILTTATARYDIGLWVALAGGSANTGPGNQCYHGILRPLEPTFTNYGPYRNLDGDYCGDVLQNDGPIYQELQSLYIKCTDTSGTGLMDEISTCTSWDNNSNTLCSSVAGAVPGTGSKCNCEQTPLTAIPISQIVVRKVTEPADSGPVFDFTATGPGLSPNPTPFSLSNGGSWNSGNLPAGGTYSVTEDAPLPTGWFQTNVACTDGQNSYNPAGFTMPAGKTVECTFTNSKAAITVTKYTLDKDGNPVDAAHLFTFGINTNPARTAQVKNYVIPADTYAFGVPPGTYTVSELGAYINQPGNWQLTEVICYKAGVELTNVWTGFPSKDASGLTVAAGESIDCFFTNQAGPLAVTLASFTANVQPATGVALAWETVSDSNIRGFNMYRGGSESGPWTKLNNEEIASPTPGAFTGNAYAFTDSTAAAGATYWYQLEDVSLSGAVASHPPMMVVVNTPTAVKLAGLGATPALSSVMPLAAIGFALLSGFAVARRQRR